MKFSSLLAIGRSESRAAARASQLQLHGRARARDQVVDAPNCCADSSDDLMVVSGNVKCQEMVFRRE
jgi:hypothetical protein